MKPEYNQKSGMIEIHEEYDGELAMSWDPADDVDPDDVLVYILFRDNKDGGEAYSGDGACNAPMNWGTRQEAEDALSMLDPADGWLLYAVSWCEDGGGEEDEIEDESEALTPEVEATA